MSHRWLRAVCAEATGTDGHPTQEKTQWKHFEGGLVSDKRRPEARRSWFLCNRTLWPQHNGRGLTDEEHCCWVESPEWRCPHHSGTTASRKFHNSNAKKRKQLWTNAWINHQVIFNAKKKHLFGNSGDVVWAVLVLVQQVWQGEIGGPLSHKAKHYPLLLHQCSAWFTMTANGLSGGIRGRRYTKQYSQRSDSCTL